MPAAIAPSHCLTIERLKEASESLERILTIDELKHVLHCKACMVHLRQLNAQSQSFRTSS